MLVCLSYLVKKTVIQNDDTSNQIQCSHCDKVFPRKSDLLSHLWTPDQCNIASSDRKTNPL